MRFILFLLLFTITSLTAFSQTPTVRILFYTGNVTVKSSKGSGKASIGQQLGDRDELTLAAASTLQLSVNGKVVKYDKPAKVKVADAVKRAGSGENAAVANTVRTLAAASGANRNQRSSTAGATRIEDSSKVLTKNKKKVVKGARDIANDELKNQTGIDNPLDKVESAVKSLTGPDDMIILEPRATYVPSGAVRFRWLKAPSAGGYHLAVKNYLGEEVFTMETTDTLVTWNDAKLPPEQIYTWTLTDAKNSLHSTGATFYRLSDANDAVVQGGVTDIRRELGEDNPALPLVLGEFYGDNGCYGEAANYFTQGAMKSPQHYQEFMSRATDQYEYQMFMPEEELQAVYKRK